MCLDAWSGYKGRNAMFEGPLGKPFGECGVAPAFEP